MSDNLIFKWVFICVLLHKENRHLLYGPNSDNKWLMVTDDQLPVGGILKSPNNQNITMSYKQLIEGQRYQIEAYLREGFSYREIGKRFNVSHSTISRGVKRN